MFTSVLKAPRLPRILHGHRHTSDFLEFYRGHVSPATIVSDRIREFP
jgi:hypothetical protein